MSKISKPELVLVTLAQAEEYAASKVKEALEEVVSVLETIHSNSDDQDRFQRLAVEAVQSLIIKD